MALHLDVELDEAERTEIAQTDPRSWFTHVQFANASGPRHPSFSDLDENHELKRSLVAPWLARVVPGARVLDTFCANGAFSFEAARLGATEVVGIEYDEGRVASAQLVAGILARHGWTTVPRFAVGDVYRLDEVGSGFDVTLCLGGLYHVADPARVLQVLREATATGGHLVLQTSGMLWLPGAWATFWTVGHDQAAQGFTSLRVGSGRWKYSPSLVDRLLAHAGFGVVERRLPPLLKRRRFAWYCVLARAR